MSDVRPIGVFDSGVGGLTVLHECLVTMPHEDFVYLGDHARLPYGPRTREEVRRFAHEIGLYLERQGVKMVVVACNTATSVALPDLQEELAVPVVSVIVPEAHAAVQATRNRRIGLLATELTVASGRYESLVRTLDAGSAVHGRRLPEARAADRGGRHVQRRGRRRGARVRGAAEGGRLRHRDPRLHALPAAPAGVPARFGRDVTLVFSADETAREVAETLARKGFENDATAKATYRFLTTGDPEVFRALGERFLQLPLGDVEQVARRRARGGCMTRNDGRRPDQLRPVVADPAFLEQPHGVVLWSQGKTRVLCTASVQEGVPRWLYRSGRGWMTAEYSLLPASTGERTDREAARGKQGGRTVEIQRLIGRALRGVVDFEALGERTVYLDCDVLQADGGTRCAAITGAYVAAQRALDRFGLSKALTGSVAAVSVGVVDGVSLLDLDYSEDSNADVDVNVVMTGDGRFVEVQSTAEKVPFDRARLDELLDLAAAGIEELQQSSRRRSMHLA